MSAPSASCAPSPSRASATLWPSPRALLRLFALLAAMPLVACGTICAPGPDLVAVDSHPKEATVYVDGRPAGRTPCTVPLARSGEGQIKLVLAGYKTAVVDRDKVLNGWFFPGNLLWFPLWPGVPIGMVVDLVGSNQGKYSTASVYVELEPGEPSEVVTIDEKPPAKSAPTEGTW